MDRSSQYRGDADPGDEPIYSRLFVAYDKVLTKDALQEVFSEYGNIEGIKLLKDRAGEAKGVGFIKFSKTSEAALAIEGMNAKVLPGTRRPVRVQVATNRSDVQRNDDDVDKYRRLFIHAPRSMKEEEIEKIFEKFGSIRSVIIQRDRTTGESKGFAYVSYSKFFEAAQAYEQCEKMYRPVFAKPRGEKRPQTSFESNIGILARSSQSRDSITAMMSEQVGSHGDFIKVHYICCPRLSQIQMEVLFDIIPGMVNCTFYVDLFHNCGKGTVSYSNPTSASYAVKKLNRFEYPPGMLLFVRPDKSSFGDDETHFNDIPKTMTKLKNAIEASTHSANPDLAQLAEAVAEASKLIKRTAGTSDDNGTLDSGNINYCSAKLPPPQPLADIDSQVAKRCFLVCKPAPPPLTVLRDIFCRFGNLINVYTLPNKTVGYARYANAESADQARQVLHGAEVCGVRMKVLEAEEEAPPKKRRFQSDY